MNAGSFLIIGKFSGILFNYLLWVMCIRMLINFEWLSFNVGGISAFI
jgi:hypothetical protein